MAHKVGDASDPIRLSAADVLKSKNNVAGPRACNRSGDAGALSSD